MKAEDVIGRLREDTLSTLIEVIDSIPDENKGPAESELYDLLVWNYAFGTVQ